MTSTSGNSSLSDDQQLIRDSPEAGAASLSDKQHTELDRRIDRHEENPSDVIPRGASKGYAAQETRPLPSTLNTCLPVGMAQFSTFEIQIEPLHPIPTLC